MMFWVIAVGVSFSLVYGGVIRDRYYSRQTVRSNAPSTTTRIGIEVTEGSLHNVFLRGGFTNGSASSCSPPASTSSCSIPIKHVPHVNASSSYLNWAKDDNYLDFYGAELSQSLSNGKIALGTPTFPMIGHSALKLLNSPHTSTGREERFFWYVELEMDCSQSDGFFELIVDSENLQNGRRGPGKRARSSTKRIVPKTQVRLDFPKNFDFAKLDEHQEAQKRHSLPDLQLFDIKKLEKARGLAAEPGVKEPKITGWRANMDTLSGREAKPFDIHPERVIDPLSRQRSTFSSACYGRVPFTSPYPIESHYIGLCGYSNIFRYDKNNCEVNNIP